MRRVLLTAILLGGVTTNGSWFVGGDVLWMPPLPL
jgi:hypothetical protein